MEMNPEVPASTRDEALFIPAVMREESRGAPHNARRSDLPEETQAVPQVNTQLQRNPQLPATIPHKLRNYPLHA